MFGGSEKAVCVAAQFIGITDAKITWSGSTEWMSKVEVIQTKWQHHKNDITCMRKQAFRWI